MEAEHLSRLIREALEGLDIEVKKHIVAISLFGSVARGEVTARSDVDLFVLTRGIRGGVERRRMIYEAFYSLVCETLRSLTIIDLGVEELENIRLTPLLLNIARDSIIIHDPEGLLSRLFGSIVESVERYGIERYRLPDGTYAWRPKSGGRMPRVEVEYELHTGS